MSSKLKISAATSEFKEVAKQKKKKTKVKEKYLIPSGITPFDLECSGTIHGAFLLGKINNIIGDSHSGKTLAFLTIVAECCKLKRFKGYKFYLDDVESANEFDIKRLFGKKVKKRLILLDTENGKQSVTIEDFNDKIATLLDLKEKFIYCLDSFDALTSESAQKKDKEDRKKRAKAKEKGTQADISGSYGDGKPRAFSDFCKARVQDLARARSSIFIISQTRQNLGFGAKFNPRIRSGGDALRFFSFIEYWLATQKNEKEGKRTKVTNVRIKLTKNKITGSKGEVYFPIRVHYGVDNITACIQFLMFEKYWGGSASSVNIKSFTDIRDKKGKKKKLSVKKLASYIDNNNLEEELKQECKIAYDIAMDKMKPKDRKKKYD